VHDLAALGIAAALASDQQLAFWFKLFRLQKLADQYAVVLAEIANHCAAEYIAAYG
jgi:hypothetical protein